MSRTPAPSVDSCTVCVRRQSTLHPEHDARRTSVNVRLELIGVIVARHAPQLGRSQRAQPLDERIVVALAAMQLAQHRKAKPVQLLLKASSVELRQCSLLDKRTHSCQNPTHLFFRLFVLIFCSLSLLARKSKVKQNQKVLKQTMSTASTSSSARTKEEHQQYDEALNAKVQALMEANGGKVCFLASASMSFVWRFVCV